MQGPLSTRRGIALYLLVWLLLGLVFSGLTVAATGTHWVGALLFAMPATLVFACAAGFSSYYLCRAYPLAERSGGSILLVFLFTATMCALLWTAVCIGWNWLWDGLGIGMSPPLQAAICALGIILYCLCGVANYLAIEFERARSAERRELESRLSAQDAELRMLRTQIDPHFLFNSLNSISALTSINPAAARDMTQRLADFFRHSLGLEAHRKVTLDAELTLVMHFLAIEKVRFGARLQVEQDIADDARSCLLPPMILQPLVENAVKHGIGNLTAGGVVRIRAERAGSILRIAVDNDVDEDQPAAPGSGIGQANVRQRLATAYGHQASVHGRLDKLTYRVELALPAETVEP